jgi:hypothetical protein
MFNQNSSQVLRNMTGRFFLDKIFVALYIQFRKFTYVSPYFSHKKSGTVLSLLLGELGWLRIRSTAVSGVRHQHFVSIGLARYTDVPAHKIQATL